MATQILDDDEDSQAQRYNSGRKRPRELTAPSLYGPGTELLDQYLRNQMYLVHVNITNIPAPNPQVDHEVIARMTLEKGYVRWSQLQRLCALLPAGAGLRWSQHDVRFGSHPACSFSTGAWSRGPLRGLSRSLRDSPNFSALLAGIVRALDMSFNFSAVSFAMNVLAKPHRDMQNACEHDNMLIPCNVWQGGEVWLKDSGGDTALGASGPTGRLHDVTCPLRFHSRVEHATMPWQGDRLVLIAYHTKHTAQLTTDEMRMLVDFGFNPA